MKTISTKWLPFIIVTLLISGGVFLCASEACAQGSLVVDDLLKIATQDYERGKKQNAIHQASKALLLDPNNREALDLLHKMGLQAGIYGSPPTTLNQIHALTEEIADYQQALDDLETQNQSQQEQTQQLEEQLAGQKAYLQNLISEKEQEKQRLIEQSQELRAVATMKLQEKQEEVAGLRNETEKKTDALVRLNADMFQAKEQMLANQENLEEKDMELSAVKEEYDEHKKMSEQELSELKQKYEQELVEIEEAKNALEHEVFVVKDDRAEKMKVFDGVLRQKEQELAREKDLVTVKSYELSEKEVQLLSVKKELDILRGQKADLSTEAVALRKQILEAKRDQAFRYARQEPASESQEDLVPYVKKQDDTIMELKSRIVEVLGEIKTLKKQGTEKDSEHIAQLEREVKSLEQKVREKQKDLTLYQELQNILRERIDDYQKRLKIVEGMIKDKEERILFLEEQVGADVYPE